MPVCFLGGRDVQRQAVDYASDVQMRVCPRLLVLEYSTELECIDRHEKT